MLNTIYNMIPVNCVETPKCLSNPCQNNATCINFIRGTSIKSIYQCKCTWGYTGSNCQLTIDYCDSEPCQHKSRCISHFGYYECDCVNGTRGHDCQININDCKSDEQCGYGTCVDIINGIKCTCDKG